MTSIRTLRHSFAGGEIAPELYGRIDLDKNQTGLARAINFQLLPHGPAQNRAGFEHVVKVKDSTKRTRTIRFAWSVEQTMVLEFGDQYLRFHADGDTLLEASQAITSVTQASPGVFTKNGHGYSNGQWVFITGAIGMTSLNNRFWEVRNATANTYTLRDIYTGVDLNTTTLPAYTGSGTTARVYEIATPYLEADLFALHFAQDADTITITHPGYATRELTRASATNWTLAVASFTASIAAPTGVGAANVGGLGGTPTSHTYVVTALTANGLEESVASSSANVSNDLSLAGHSNTVTWNAVAGAYRYKIYKLKNGLYGYIGTAGGSLTFSDDNIVPDTTESPPEFTDPFPSAGNYPATVAFFDGRRVFAGTDNQPQSAFFTRTGCVNNMTASTPLVASDAFVLPIAAREQNRIRHLVPLSDLLALTVGGEWRLHTANGEPIAPATAMARVQSYNGCSNVQPVVTARSAVFVQGQGGRVREISYSWEAQTYHADDITVLAPHLVDRYEITDLAFGRGPVPTLYCVRDDGVLLVNTYLPEQKVRAWSRFETDGTFESVCCVPEGNEDILYAVVKRTINGTDHRFIERLRERRFATIADAFFVDAGLAYDGAATATLTGLWHLEGETVVVLGDGAVIRTNTSGDPLTVTNGAITLNRQVEKAAVGLAYTCDLETLPLAFEAAGGGQGVKKNVTKVWMRVYESRSIKAGPDTARLREYKGRTFEPYGSVPDLLSTEIELPLDGSWGSDGAVRVRQADPLPLTVCSMVLQVAVGG